MQETPLSNDVKDESFIIQQLLNKWKTSFLWLLQFPKTLLLSSLIGGLLGLGYYLYKAPTYTARVSFVVEESKQSSGSLVSALAGQFGLDVGGMAGASNGLLGGDNVLELLKSKSLAKKALLTPYDSAGKISLADQYADVYKWRKAWISSSEVGQDIHFAPGRKVFTRLEDSLLQKIIKRITESEISIAKPDKKLNFFEINFTCRDEKISALFSQRLLQIAADFYVETKTGRLRRNVERLQQRADSLEAILDRKTYNAAMATGGLIDINPSYSAGTASAEISSRNKFIQSTIYGEIVKNLEVSRTTLIQETPTFQVVDTPEYPLKKNQWHWALLIVAGAGIAVLLVSLILINTQNRTAQK
jgi:hypothetical protein